MKALGFLLPFFVFFSGCASDAGPDFVDLAVEDGQATVRMGGDVGDRFSPDVFQVPQGTIITFDHLGGGSVHNVRSEDGAWQHRDPDLRDFVLDTGDLDPGTYRFVCDAHASVGMDGILKVVA